MKKAVFTLAVLAMATLGLRAQDSVFSYTHQGTTLYYILEANGEATMVPPMHPDLHWNDDNTAETWWGYSKPQGAVVVPDSVPFGGSNHAVTSIGLRALLHCDSIISLTLPPTVRQLEMNALRECRRLQSVNLPEGVTSIGRTAFFDCNALPSVTLPSTVVAIDYGAFGRCYSLQSVTFTPGPVPIAAIPEFCFYEDTSLVEIILPDGITTIDTGAFRHCNNLTSLTLPATLTSIGPAAFRECRSLQSLDFPATLTSIGSSAFRECYGLQSVTLPQGLTAISYACFYQDTMLARIDIPDGVTGIGDYAFGECYGLHYASLPSTLDSLGEEAFSNCHLDTLTVAATEPPALTTNTFSTYTAVVIVPCGSAVTYRRHSVWGRFGMIIEECNGIDDLEVMGYRLCVMDGRIVVEGANSETVSLYDVMGRQLATSHLSPFTFHLSTPGVYLVKVGDRPARKVVVVK